ncbi:MAG: hypothetical protein AMXMBFR84_37940 [Candidatus Hydrogenedentota bacterium]
MLIGAYAAVSLLLTYIGYRLYHAHLEQPPAWLSISFAVGSIVGLSFFFVPVTLMIGPYGALAISFPAVIMITWMVRASASEVMTDFLYGQHFVTPAPSDYGRARKKAVENDVEGALKEYRNYFEADPRRPAPLFAAALLAERKEKYDYAVTFYKDIMRQFEKHPKAWAKAAYRLALIHDQQFHDAAAAARLMREILAKAKRTEEAGDAANYLARYKPAMQGDQGFTPTRH